MAEIKVLNTSGEEVSTLTLADSVFAAEINEDAVHAAVVNFLANQRQGTQSALTRAEVSGGGKKPWRQKGTGRARQGSTRSPQWTHGGVVFAPKPRDYSYRLNKKVKRIALKSALSSKLAEGKLIVLDDIAMEDYKTKTVIGIIDAIKAEKAYFVTGEVNKVFVKSAANIEGVGTAEAGSINVYDILAHDTLVLTVDAVKKIEEVYA